MNESSEAAPAPAKPTSAVPPAGGASSENGSAHASANLHKYTSGNAFYHWHLRRFMHRLYEMTACTTPQTVLDAGCGEGFVTRFLRKQHAGWHLTGVDASAPAIAYARCHDERCPQTEFVVGDLYALPFDDDAFDTVLCSEVLEHLEHPGEALAELRRVASRAVVLSVPREPYFQWLNDLGQAMGLSPDPGHVNFWTEDGFRRFVQRQVPRARFETKHIYQLAAGPVT